MNNYEQSMIFDNLKEDLFDGIMCYGDSKNATERTYDDLAFYLYNRIMNFCGFNNEKLKRVSTVVYLYKDCGLTLNISIYFETENKCFAYHIKRDRYSDFEEIRRII